MTDLNDLAVELGQMGRRITQHVDDLTVDYGGELRKQAAQFATGIKHAPRYPRSITRRVSRDLAGVQAEIGPRATAQNQGFLGWVLENGNATTPPNAHLGPAFDRVAPAYLAAVQRAVAEATQ